LFFRQLKPTRTAILAGILCAVFAGATVLWLSLDRAPPNWDDAWYLTNSLTVYDSLAHGGIGGYAARLNSVFGFKAPLIAALPAPFYLLFGRRWHAAFLVNIVCMLALSWVLYRIASRWWSERAALLAVTIAGTMPLLYGLSRWYMLEYPLAALAAISILLLIESASFERRGMALSFGAACGMGMLLKVTFAAFILPVFLYVWAASRNRLRSLVLTALPCVILAMPWYAGHLRRTLAYVLDSGYGFGAAVQGTGPIFAPRTITTYLSHVIISGISEYYAALSIPLILWSACRPAGRSWFHSLPKQSAAMLLLWLAPFAIFLFGGNKDIRFIAPILPAFALIMACLLDAALPRNALGACLAFFLLVFPVAQLFAVSFGVPWRANGLTYARRFTRETWPHDEMLKAIAANTSLRPGEKAMLLVGTDRAGFNANNVELTVTALQLPFDVETTAYERDFDVLLRRLAQASYFLYKEGGEPESPAFNPYFNELVRHARQDGRYTPLPYERRLPDGGVARILKNSAGHAEPANTVFLAARLEQAEEFAIDLGGTMALTGLSLRRTPDSVIVKCRWRCLKRPDRDYWCFTHVLDSSGRIISQLDHPILGGTPPLQSWNAGDAGIEETHLRLPAEFSGATLRLRIGLYDPPTGDRLRFELPQGLAASRFTPADHSTALIAPI
jgi:4-amino-4-deoxy-L-arabinose transferase-like glycosyltransferase